MDEFQMGQYVIYKNGNRYELGRIKRICADGRSAFVYYHSGETAAKTCFSDLRVIENERNILTTNLGGVEGKTWWEEMLE